MGKRGRLTIAIVLLMLCAICAGDEGGSVYTVTSLAEDSSPGTLAWALAQPGPRTVR